MRVLLLFFLLIPSVTTRGDEVDNAIVAIGKAGPQGKGAAAARLAARRLAKRGVEIVPRIFEALDTPNVVAANWYRTALEQIIEAELARPKPKLPLAFLKKYARQPKRQGRPRRFAMSLLSRLEPKFVRQLIPTLIHDPEFRQEAINEQIKLGDALKKAGKKRQAVKVFSQSFKAARESGQISGLAGRLKSLGQKVSIIDHMGFINRWYLLGPFDAPGTSGFTTSFPPERRVDLKAKYTGQRGDIRWRLHQTKGNMAQLNLIQSIAATKEAVGYAYTEVHSPRTQNVQVRCGADDNLTIWVNGKKVLARLQWLNGIRLDRFTAPVQLRKGANRVLVKICQGPQHKNPAVPNNWSMQLRFCDQTGASVGAKVTIPAPK